jgi:hypothetical protein
MPDSIALDASQSSVELAEDRGRSKTLCALHKKTKNKTPLRLTQAISTYIVSLHEMG